jgi:hypothetical protein
VGGFGWCFIITCFLQECIKLQSHCKENCKAFKCYSLNDLIDFLFFVLQFCSDREMYRKNGRVACKNRASGQVVGLVVVFAVHCKTAKNFTKCLIFNGFLFYAILYASFTHALRKLTILLKTCDNKTTQRINSLIFNALQTSRKCLSLNAFKQA